MTDYTKLRKSRVTKLKATASLDGDK